MPAGKSGIVNKHTSILHGFGPIILNLSPVLPKNTPKRSGLKIQHRSGPGEQESQGRRRETVQQNALGPGRCPQKPLSDVILEQSFMGVSGE